jgi:hypothetical protein
MCPTVLITACVFNAVLMFLPFPSSDEAIFTELLSNNVVGYTCTQSDGMDLRSVPMRWAQVPWYTKCHKD